MLMLSDFFPKRIEIFGQFDVVLRDVVLEIGGILEVLTRSGLLMYLWVQPWIFLNNIR